MFWLFTPTVTDGPVTGRSFIETFSTNHPPISSNFSVQPHPPTSSFNLILQPRHPIPSSNLATQFRPSYLALQQLDAIIYLLPSIIFTGNVVQFNNPCYTPFQCCLMWLVLGMFVVAYFIGRSAQRTGDRKRWHLYEKIVSSGQFIQSIVCWIMLTNPHFREFMASNLYLNHTTGTILFWFTVVSLLSGQIEIILDLFNVEMEIRFTRRAFTYPPPL